MRSGPVWQTGPVRVYLGSDHAGFELKTRIIEWLAGAGHEPVDCGPETYVADDDYPPYVMSAARGVVNDPGSLGIVIGGSGNGEQIAANKIPGIRAAVAWTDETAQLARQHNDANVLVLGGRLMGADMAADILGFFAEPHNRAVLDDLAREVTVLDYEGPAQRTASPLAGKTIVFTGTLERMSRSEAKARAEALGANVTGSVSAKTDYVVAGADPGSKATKAAALGVRLLDEAAWLALAGDAAG